MQAYGQAVNLSVNTLFVPDLSSMSYLNYGAAVSEVSFSSFFCIGSLIEDCLFDMYLKPACESDLTKSNVTHWLMNSGCLCKYPYLTMLL